MTNAELFAAKNSKKVNFKVTNYSSATFNIVTAFIIVFYI